MGRMREDYLSFFVARARKSDKKLEPFGGEEGHVTAENEIPLIYGRGRCGVLQCGDNAAERAFAGPLVFDDFKFAVEVGVFLSGRDNCNFGNAGLGERDNIQQQRPSPKTNERLVAAKARTRAAS